MYFGKMDTYDVDRFWGSNSKRTPTHLPCSELRPKRETGRGGAPLRPRAATGAAASGRCEAGASTAGSGARDPAGGRGGAEEVGPVGPRGVCRLFLLLLSLFLGFCCFFCHVQALEVVPTLMASFTLEILSHIRRKIGACFFSSFFPPFVLVPFSGLLFFGWL